MRARRFLATFGAAAVLVSACTDGPDDVELEAPVDADDGALDPTTDAGDGSGGAPSETDLADLPSTTIETPTLDGRTLTITAPGNVVASEPTRMRLQLVDDSFSLQVVADTMLDDVPFEDWPEGDDEQVVTEEDRWDGRIRIASIPDAIAAALYDDGDTRLFLTADPGPSSEPVTSIDRFREALEHIDIQRRGGEVVVTTTDPGLQRGLSLTYALAGIDADLEIVDDNGLFQRLTVDPADGPIDGAGGEVVASPDGVIERIGDDVLARIRLVQPDDVAQQRGLDLMTQLQLGFDG